MGAAKTSEVEASPASRSAASRTVRKAKNERSSEDVFIVFSKQAF
jgi:hypothetical protein